MSYLQIAEGAMLFFGGLWAGAILIFAVERVNLWRRMPLEQYAVDFRRSVLRVDPMLPILGGLSGLAAIYVAWNADGVRQALAWGAVAGMAIVIFTSCVLAEPMNSKFRRRAEGDMPDDCAGLRDKWRAFHYVRNVLALATLACMVGATL